MASEVAIIGMSCRFPGANDVATFWQNIVDRRESISYLGEDELRSNGVSEALLRDKNYLRSGFVVPDIELFDAEFFGFTPREAQLLDPQHRLFLECAWHALEHAGHAPDTYEGRIGVYAGAFSSVYLMHIYSQPGLVDSVGEITVRHANEKDYLATRVSYKLNLKGPSISLQTSCSTSLVAVHTAVQSLLSGECDMALAGGVSLSERGKGVLYQTGGLMSPDGRCRPFDARAGGTVFGSGLGVVVLKRLDEARKDGNTIYAVIKGSALNNDGSDKVGFTAPSVNGQVEVILEALAMAEVSADSVDLMEAHGTGTPLGDPIEIQALTHAWRTQTSRRGYCALGSVKANVGHLGVAAGIAGLIKTTLALHHKTLPPAINFEVPNPDIDFANSPFFVNTDVRPWPAPPDHPRTAAVSSFGMGGTNAHLVLAEAPPRDEAPRAAATGDRLLLLSARSEAALRQAASDLGRYLESDPACSLDDVATTLRAGRRTFSHRAAFVAASVAQAIEVLGDGSRLSPTQALQAPAVAFLFPGQGSQYEGACQGLYASQPEFREHFDRCCAVVRRCGGPDIPAMLAGSAAGPLSLTSTEVAQPALFALEYALARMMMAMGLAPAAMLGHSVGEYVAAALAGVFSLEDALRLVVVRGRLMQRTAPGKMLSVSLAEAQLAPYLQAHPEIALAAINGPAQCVVAGPETALAALHPELARGGVITRHLVTSHAFHSSLMDPILDDFLREVEKIALRPPTTPYVSNVTGGWITAAQATDPRYWRDHLRKPVRFDAGARLLLEDPGRVLVEVGPGTALSGLVRGQPGRASARRVVPLSRHPKDQAGDPATLQRALGDLWCHGVALPAPPAGTRIALPGYPFERKRYWIDRIFDAPIVPSRPRDPAVVQADDSGVSGYRWVERPLAGSASSDERGRITGRAWTLQGELGGAVAAGIASALQERHAVIRSSDGLSPGDEVDGAIWFAGAAGLGALEPYAAALGESTGATPRALIVVSERAVNVDNVFELGPEQRALCGQIAALAMRYPALRWTHLDVAVPPSGVGVGRRARAWIADLVQDEPWRCIAWRGPRRYVLGPAPRAATASRPVPASRVAIATSSVSAALAIANQMAGAQDARSFTVALGEGVASWDQVLAAAGPDARDVRGALDALRARGAEVALHPGPTTADGIAALVTAHDALDAVVCQAGSAADACERLRRLHDASVDRPLAAIACIVAGATEAALPTSDHYRLMAQVQELEWTHGTAVSLLSCSAATPDALAVRVFDGAGYRWFGDAAPAATRDAVPPGAAANGHVSGHGNGHGNGHGHAAGTLPDVEATVTEIWKTLFGVESVDREADFFAAGGTSLVAMQMIAQVRERFALELSIESLFDDPTVRGVTAQIRTLLGDQAPGDPGAADSAELQELLRLSSDESSAELLKALLETESTDSAG